MKRGLTYLMPLLLLLIALTLGVSPTHAKAPMTLKDIVAEAAKNVERTDLAGAKALYDKDYVVIDARDQYEYKKGHIKGAVNISRGLMEWKIEKEIADKNTNILIYCVSGGRSCLAAHQMQKMGYKNVVNMHALFADWVKAGYPVE